MNTLIKLIVVGSGISMTFISCGDSEPALSKEKEMVAHVETFAGSSQGFEDGPLLTAKFKWPEQIVRTSDGSFYVLDQSNTAVRKISPDGMVNTVYHNEPNTVDCMAVDGDDILYLANGPFVVKVDEAGGTEVIANGTNYNDERYFSGIWGMAFHPDGNLYAAESANARIMKISKTGIVSLYAGGVEGYVDGNLAEAKFGDRQGMIITPNGDFFLADFNNNKYRKISGGQVTTIAGSGYGYSDGSALRAMFGHPFAMARTKEGTIYVTGTEHVIRKISPEGYVSTTAGSIPGHVDDIGRRAQFFNPAGLVLDEDENLYVADASNNLIRKIEFKAE